MILVVILVRILVRICDEVVEEECSVLEEEISLFRY